MDSVWKQNLVFLILESPVLVYILLGRIVYVQLLPSLGPVGAYIVYWLGFAFVGLLTLILFVAVRQSALSSVAGRRFLVGHVYDSTGKAEPIQLQLGEYSEIGETRDGARVYAVWTVEDGERVVDYVLVCPRGKELSDVLSASSVWTVEAGWWFADAQVYPVTLYKPSTEAADVLRQEAKLEQSVPVYLIRDAPGLVLDGGGINDVDGEEAERNAVDARGVLDALRSKQLYAENLALRQELESLSGARDTIDDLATDKAMAFIQAHLENRKVPKQRAIRLDKWFWIFLIVVVLVAFGLWFASKWFALQQASVSAPQVSAPTNTTAGGGGG